MDPRRKLIVLVLGGMSVVGLAACAGRSDGKKVATPLNFAANATPEPLGQANKMPDGDSEPGPLDRDELRHAIRAELDAVRDEVDTLSAHAASASEARASQLGVAMAELLRQRSALSRAAIRLDEVTDAEWLRFAEQTRALIDDTARLIARAHQRGL